ncbi:hypothetical protein NIES4071_68220 [Calothrix sp. NIES-4071]|nr:hypothetical protein NIES4071_68220 [Calothrix sp. NIES-4071]BAZ61100.1 hypothetical protein NIES4105_68180 [Calothrix sp. NIES-4105]
MGIEPQRSLDNKSEIGVERHEGAAAPDAGRRYSPRKSVSTPRVSSINWTAYLFYGADVTESGLEFFEDTRL